MKHNKRKNMKNALIIGASGGIGSALYDYYLTQKNYELVKSLSRSNDGFDITSEQNVNSQIDSETSIYDLVIIATGGVQIDNDEPEKSIKRLNANAMLNQFSLNAVGPALILSRIHKLIPKDRPSHVIVLSARVGSIEDNNLGG